MHKGLSSQQVSRLLKEYGKNELLEQTKKPIFINFFEQLNNFLVYLLIVAVVISFLIGDLTDGILILTIIILNACFGLYQEIKAEDSVALLKDLSTAVVRVVRNGQNTEIDSRELVPGDIVYVEEGTKIPADGHIIDSAFLEVNESVLTGESLQVEKKIDEAVYMGTIVARGRGYIQIDHTGSNTEFGEIAKRISIIEDLKTPLQTKLEVVGGVIGAIGIVSAIIVFTLSTLYGSTLTSSFLLAVSLAVAVVPEGLPAVMTATLAIGVGRMARRGAIIRRLTSIEALGSTTLIATDKTGTLTTNKMKVSEVYIDDSKLEVDAFVERSQESALILSSILCSTASLVQTHSGESDVLGDPTEGALLFMASGAGYDIDNIRGDWKLTEEKLFDTETKRMSVLTKHKDKSFAFIKGAPERILEVVSHIEQKGHIRAITKRDRDKITYVLDNWSSKGLRVIGFAHKKNSRESLDTLEEKGTYVFAGLVALYDPPRPEVKDSVQSAHAAGISVVMITGDNPKTAEAIATSVGIMKPGDEIITGAQLEEYSDAELFKILPKVRVFARTSPTDKHRIVNLYQQMGEIVTVTGDGVNDAIALKAADIGVAMGRVGTDVAREVADMVISDDNFSTIVAAIEEGRQIVSNLKNALKYLLTGNLTEAAVIIGGFALGVPHILLPIQVLYINLISDGFPALALAFSPRDGELMNISPQKKLNLLERFDYAYIFGVGALTSSFILALYFIFASQAGATFAKTVAFSTLAIMQPFIFADLWLSHRSLIRNIGLIFSTIFIAAYLLPFILQLAIVKIHPLIQIFRVVALSWNDYLLLIMLSSLILPGVWFVKKVIGVLVSR